MPDAFIFALLLTILTCVVAFIWLGTSPLEIIKAWYQGFFDLLAFTMQIVLIIITGYSIALSPIVKRTMDQLTLFVKTPAQVYFLTVLIGSLLSFVSFGWIIIASLLARELALRVRGVNLPFLVACVYFSVNSWVAGLSSAIPLLLNTRNNYLIETGLLENIIPISYTLKSSLNLIMLLLFILCAPLLMLALKPKSSEGKGIHDLMSPDESLKSEYVEEAATDLHSPVTTWSDRINNSIILIYIIGAMGLVYIVYHFSTWGLDLNLNIMIFIFLMVGLLLHKTPINYSKATERSSKNISSILFQYPFYAGIMGIMIYTGLGEKLGQVMASLATIHTYPFYAYVTGAFVNFAIPSAGGEFAVIGPSLITAIHEIGAGLPHDELLSMIARGSLSVAYGESLSNMLHPFFLLIIIQIMGNGIKLKPKDAMGYLVIPFIIFFILQSLILVYWPL